MSLRGYLLQYSDPDWVATVAKGLTIIVWMLVLSVFVSVASAVLGMATSPIVAQLIGFLAQAVSVCGVWLEAIPKLPSLAGRGRGGSKFPVFSPLSQPLP